MILFLFTLANKARWVRRQWFANTLRGVHADNTFANCNARAGIGGVELGGGLQVGGLCCKCSRSLSLSPSLSCLLAGL